MGVRFHLFFCVIFGLGLCKSEAPDFSVVERILSPETNPKRQVAETFTKNVHAVPGYGAKENDNSGKEEPPFEPTPECGDQYLNLTEGAFGTITSPNYPESYPPNLACEWIIEGIPGTVVEATFFDLVTQPWLFTFTDYVQVSTSGNWNSFRRFAGDANEQMPFTLISQENRIAIRFKTSKWLNFRGFTMTYVVRAMKATDDSPPVNEYGSAVNNDLVAVCSSKPILTDGTNNKHHSIHYKSSDNQIIERMERQARIVNGAETLPHQYPFMVILLTNNGAFCGGSLIDSHHVLTAAYCLQPDDDSEKLQQVDLIFGVYNLTNRAENLYSRQIRTVQYPDIGKNVFIHPNYDRSSGANDIAIVKVNKVKITKYVQPVFLPSVYTESNSFDGWTLTTLGWGTVDGTSNVQLAPVLRQGAATVISNSQCREEFSGSVTGNNICTKNPISNPTGTEPENSTTEVPASGNNTETNLTESTDYESPCHGDSGAPLIAEFLEDHPEIAQNPNEAGPSTHDCVNAKYNGNGGNSLKNPLENVCQRPKDSNVKWYVQVGVLSFGSRVCGLSIPVVYTRVTAYLQWIAYVTGRHG